MIVQFFVILWGYILDVLPYLVLGFLLSGLVNEFVPAGFVEKHLGGRGLKPLLYATLAGTLLPVCCCAIVPVAVSFHRKGARLGPVLALLVATPATSLAALLVSYGLLGIEFTVYIFFAVIIMGLVMGFIGNFLRDAPQPAPAETAGCDCAVTASGQPGRRIVNALRYAFVEMPREIGLEMALGLVLAAVVAAVTPVGNFVGEWLSGGLGYPFSLVFGVLMYICSTASVPLVDAFISQGMNVGAGMVLLMAGPVTSWSTILVLRKTFSGHILAVYLAVICAVSLTLGWLYSVIV